MINCDRVKFVHIVVSDEGDTLLPQQQEHDGTSNACDVRKIRNNIGFWQVFGHSIEGYYRDHAIVSTLLMCGVCNDYNSVLCV